MPRIVRGSPALQERLTVGWEREAATLAAAIAEATGADADDLVPAVVARTLAWTLITIFRAAFDGLLAGEDPSSWPPALRPQAARAYDQLAAGLGDYGVAGPAGTPRRSPVPSRLLVRGAPKRAGPPEAEGRRRGERVPVLRRGCFDTWA